MDDRRLPEGLSREPGDPALVVHLIHGTFPRGVGAQVAWKLRSPFVRKSKRLPFPPPKGGHAKPLWFEDCSAFEEEIRRLLAVEVSDQVRFDRFQWSGSNSFSARDAAATELHSWLLKAAGSLGPHTKHAVLAHSHGGTIAVHALDQKVVDRTPVKVCGLMTLGTPFVRLVQRIPLSDAAGLKKLTALLLPAALLLMAVLASASVIYRSSSPWSLAFGVLLGLTALAAVGSRHVPVASACVLAALIFGGPVARSDSVALAAVAIVGAFFSLRSEKWPVDREKSQGLVQSQLMKLPCPLLAVRAAGDEAGLAIGAAGLTERIFQIGSRFLDRFSSWLEGRLNSRLKVLMGLSIGWLAGYFVLRVHDRLIPTPRETWEVYVLPIGAVGLWLLPVGVVIIFSWMVPALAGGFAVGKEVADLLAVAGFEAEPLPHLDEDSIMHLVIDPDAGAELEAGLHHSLYDAPSVQSRIAIWITGLVKHSADEPVNQIADGPVS